MDLIDLLRAIPGLLLIGLLPGVAIASLIRPTMPGWWRLAMAPGLSAGVVGVIGLLYHDAHVAFELRTVLPPVAALGAAAVLRGAVRPAPAPDPDLPLRSRAGTLVVAGGLAAGLLSAAILVSAFRVQPLPIANDAPVHGALTQAIAVQHDVMSPQPEPVAHTASVRPRPAFEAAAALVAGLGGMRPVSAMLPLALLGVLLLPLSLAVLMYESTRNWRMAAVTPFLGVGMTLITFAIRFGEYPYVVDLTLVVPLIVSARRILMGVALRHEWAMVATVVAAIWAVHGLEVVTALVVGVPFALASVLDRVRWRDVVERGVLVALAMAAGALFITVITVVPEQPTAVLPTGVALSDQASNFLGVWGPRHGAPTAYTDFLKTELNGVVPAIVYVLGLLAAIRVKGMRWALVSHALLVVILADVAYAVLLRRLWTALFPWSVIDRVVSIQWFVVPLLMSWGIFHLRDVLRMHGPQGRRPAARALAGVFVVAALLTPLIGGIQEASRIRQAAGDEGRSTDADLAALVAMNQSLPAGTVVLTLGRFDAGQWVDAVTRDLEWAPLAYSRGVVKNGGIPLVDDRAEALAAACNDPKRARAALTGIGAVFAGADVVAATPVRWHVDCIAALPGVREVEQISISGRTARVLAVEGSVARSG